MSRAAASPRALRSPALVAFFGRVMARYMQRHFHGVRLSGGAPAVPRDRPLIVYANHPSWWDAAFIIVLATRLFPDRVSFGPIDAAALGQYRFMRRIGLFPVEPGRRGAAAFLRTALDILAEPLGALWVTAEGTFRDPRQRPIRLRPGVAHLARLRPDAAIVPLALEYPFWDERTPEALCRFGVPVPHAELARHDPEAINDALALHLTATADALAADAMRRDPAAFETLLRGRVGVGGVYDLWRRGGAWLSGRRFDASHGARE